MVRRADFAILACPSCGLACDGTDSKRRKRPIVAAKDDLCIFSLIQTLWSPFQKSQKRGFGTFRLLAKPASLSRSPCRDLFYIKKLKKPENTSVGISSLVGVSFGHWVDFEHFQNDQSTVNSFSRKWLFGHFDWVDGQKGGFCHFGLPTMRACLRRTRLKTSHEANCGRKRRSVHFQFDSSTLKPGSEKSKTPIWHFSTFGQTGIFE